METSSPPKKMKKTPLQTIKLGEAMIEIKLKIIITEAVRIINEKNIIWTLVATDGFAYKKK
ncbi:hypothetical protein Mgra_00010138 [Meloidogyne graminicola]|uniref:Uncharacterized protein n=1 Tax=Meloidogyne graminicola TaxID=189291 RepID=A0A8S9ZCR4_9BILA|nr:hypothetical protein Mgra_00010138 [Meloidogyne graminicola]